MEDILWQPRRDNLRHLQQLFAVPPPAFTGANAAQLNITGVSEYSASAISHQRHQFSDVYPTDWAYQALANLRRPMAALLVS